MVFQSCSVQWYCLGSGKNLAPACDLNKAGLIVGQWCRVGGQLRRWPRIGPVILMQGMGRGREQCALCKGIKQNLDVFFFFSVNNTFKCTHPDIKMIEIKTVVKAPKTLIRSA